MSNIQILALTDIRIDGGTQSRTALHDATVADYADALMEGATLPPIVVFFDGTANWLADGFHRFLANKRIGAITLQAEVRQGTLTDAQLFAYGANQAHGLRRTNEDKRKAVLGTLALRPDWSDRAIAKHVGVTHPFVAAARSPAVAERQGAARQKSAARVESDSTPTGSVATETAASSTPEQRAPGPVAKTKTAAEKERDQAAEDAHGDDDPLQLLEQMQKEIEGLSALVKAAEADDTKAEAVKWRKAYDHACRQQSEEMDKAKRATEREAWAVKQLRRCGKALGVEDPDKIAPAVEAFVRQHKVAA